MPYVSTFGHRSFGQAEPLLNQELDPLLVYSHRSLLLVNLWRAGHAEQAERSWPRSCSNRARPPRWGGPYPVSLSPGSPGVKPRATIW